MKEKTTTRVGQPPVFLAPFLIIFVLLLGIAIYYAIANHSFNQQRTEKGTTFTMTDLNMIESRPPVVIAGGAVTQESIPASLSKTLATDFDARPCADFIQGMFTVNILALSADRTQALVGLGCGSTGLEKAVFVQKDGQWHKFGGASFHYRHELSGQPFDTVLGVPNCHDMTTFSLDSAIAPVCYDGDPAQPDRYTYRDNHS